MKTATFTSESTALGQNEALLRVDDIAVSFQVAGNKRLRAVDGVSFEIRPGETLGIIGESGSGKSTVARAVMGLTPITQGIISLDGQPLGSLSRRERRRLAHRVQMIFQDSNEALDPHLDARSSIAEPLIVAGGKSRAEAARKVDTLLDQVGLTRRHGARRPSELSGGQRQRVSIARALALDPDLLICDEAVSALDVSVQAEILNLFIDLQAERKLAYLFISHDIGVVSRICDRVGVMYLGHLMETGHTQNVVRAPAHPYTQALLSAEPQPLPSWLRSHDRITLKGEMPSPLDPPTGCRFRTRCPYAQKVCEQPPPLVEVEIGRTSACHFAQDLYATGGTGLRVETVPNSRMNKEMD